MASAQGDFVGLSEALTGFDRFELDAAGVAPIYKAFLEGKYAAQMTALLLAWSKIAALPPPQRPAALKQQILDDPTLGPLARGLTTLWYTATWFPLPNETTDPETLGEAYPEGLVWKAAGTHPLSAKPTGFGGWALPPDATAPPKRARA